jgi:hypothetical protein
LQLEAQAKLEYLSTQEDKASTVKGEIQEVFGRMAGANDAPSPPSAHEGVRGNDLSADELNEVYAARTRRVEALERDRLAQVGLAAAAQTGAAEEVAAKVKAECEAAYEEAIRQFERTKRFAYEANTSYLDAKKKDRSEPAQSQAAPTHLKRPMKPSGCARPQRQVKLLRSRHLVPRPIEQRSPGGRVRGLSRQYRLGLASFCSVVGVERLQKGVCSFQAFSACTAFVHTGKSNIDLCVDFGELSYEVRTTVLVRFQHEICSYCCVRCLATRGFQAHCDIPWVRTVSQVGSGVRCYESSTTTTTPTATPTPAGL